MKLPSGFPNLFVRLLVFQSIPAGCLPVDMCPEGVHGIAPGSQNCCLNLGASTRSFVILAGPGNLLWLAP